MKGDEKLDGWRNMIELAIGCWLIASPFVLQFLSSPNASAMTIGIGAAITLLALLSIAKQQAWEEWGNLLLAIVLVLSPWIVDFVAVDSATWNALATGAILAIIAINSLGSRRSIAPSTPTHTTTG